MTEFLQRKGSYNPDVLSCLANLSNDEVFTPPAIVNRMLDLLPPDIFRDPGARFLDPACKISRASALSPEKVRIG